MSLALFRILAFIMHNQQNIVQQPFVSDSQQPALASHGAHLAPASAHMACPLHLFVF